MEKLEHQEVPKLKGEMQKSILKESSQNFTNRQAQTKAVIWFLAIVIVLLSLGMIYLANMLNSLKEDSDTVVMDVVNDKADIVNESAESERIMDDITKDWKTYTSEEYGFSFKYPNHYFVLKDSINGLELGFSAFAGEDSFTYLTISTTNITNLKSVPVCVGNVYTFPCISKEGWGQAQPISSTDISGHQANSAYVSYGVDASYHIVQTQSVPKIELKMNVSGGGLERDFNQILSTFEFADRAEVNKTGSATIDVYASLDINSDYTPVNKYTFTYPQENVVSVDTVNDNGDRVSGISLLLSNDVSLSIRPSFEGNSVPYYDAKPIVKEIQNMNFSKDMYRILNKYTSTFSYVTDYGVGAIGCNQWDPLPLACHMSNAFLVGKGGYGIVCNTNNLDKAEMCDNIVQNLDISVQKIQ